jgi:hypothetical protein
MRLCDGVGNCRALAHKDALALPVNSLVVAVAVAASPKEFCL